MFKISLSKPTFEPDDTDPNNLIFSSEYDTLKYESVVDVTMHVDYTDWYFMADGGIFGDIFYHRKEVEIVHGLPYIPFFDISWIDSAVGVGTGINLPLYAGDVVSFISVSGYADANKIYIVYQDQLENGDTGSDDFDFVVRIFKNEIDI